MAEKFFEHVFFIQRARFASLDRARLRARFAFPDGHPEGPIPDNLLAVMIAFGSRFTPLDTLDLDREECMDRDEMNGRVQRPPRSRIVQLVMIRTREVVEVQKTHRIPSLENIQVLSFMETLLARECYPAWTGIR